MCILYVYIIQCLVPKEEVEEEGVSLKISQGFKAFPILKGGMVKENYTFQVPAQCLTSILHNDFDSER